MTITSAQNPKVAFVKALQKKPALRRKEKCFVAEGERLLQTIPPESVRSIYVSESYPLAHTTSFATEPIYVTDAVMKKMSDTVTPQGILAVVSMPFYELDDLLGTHSLLLILDGIKDPGNVGTMFRTAEAAGATGVILANDCADIFSPKCVRATMSSVFRMPCVETKDLAATLLALKEKQITLYAADQNGTSYKMADYPRGLGIIIGSEANGLSRIAREASDAVVSLPMHGEIESLNAAIAAGILLYEAAARIN